MLKKRIKSVHLVILVIILLLSYSYIKWINLPADVISSIYTNGYSGTDPEAIRFANIVERCKQEKYNKPQVRWNYTNNTWYVVTDFYLYSPEDGSVVNVIVLTTRMKLNDKMLYILSSKIDNMLDFGETQIINGSKP